MRKKREQIAQDIDNIKDILNKGANRAHELAEAKMQLVREKLGVVL